MPTANNDAPHATGRPETKLAIQPELLDIQAVTRLLGDCSSRHIHRLVDAHRMPRPVKLGTLLRWRRSEMLNWISAGCPSLGDGRGAQE